MGVGVELKPGDYREGMAKLSPEDLGVKEVEYWCLGLLGGLWVLGGQSMEKSCGVFRTNRCENEKGSSQISRIEFQFLEQLDVPFRPAHRNLY